SNWKIYEALPAGFTAGPWGATNQSAQSTAQYAGPWNHWPVSRIVSDGRQAWDGDGRVNHFALSTGGGSSVVMYGFSNQNSTSTQDITTVFPAVNAWRESPPVSSISDGTSQGYNMDQREYNLTRSGRNLSVTLAGSSSTPIANPCFVIKNWNSNNAATLRINRIPTTNFRQGIIYDTDGTQTLIIYVPMQSTSSTNFVIGRRQIITRTDHEVYTESETSEICNVDIIRSTATVGAGANLTYSARQEIILENGFTASKDCVFVAQIGNCQGPQPEILVETRATEAILLDRDIDAHEVSVFPIPASTHLNYNVKEMEAVEVIYLFDMLGRLVREERNLNGRIDIADLPHGQYALMFVINGQRVHRLVQKM
ncbi:MAG: 3-coathanger stack domain-containing protein, partial [Bacteroidota bacterium]